MKKSLKTILAIIVGLASLTAAAETAPSTAAASKFAPLDNLKLSFYGLWHGPKPTDISSRGPDGKVQFMESALTLGYKLSPNMTVSASHNFNLYLLREKNMSYVDPTVKLAHTKLYDNGKGMTLAGAIRSYLPVSQGSRDNGLITQLRADQTVNYDIAGTKWSLGSDFYERIYFYSKDLAPGKAKKLRLLYSPYAAYQTLPNLGFKVQLEKEMVQMIGQDLNKKDIMTTYLSVSWDVTSKFMFSSNIEFKPTDIRADASDFYFEFLYKFL